MGGNTALYILRLAGSFDGVVWCLGLPESWPGRPWARWPWPWARGPGLYIQLFQYSSVGCVGVVQRQQNHLGYW